MTKLFTTLVMFFLLSGHAQSDDLNLLTEVELDRRYLSIQSVLKSDREKSYWWQHGWEAAYGVSSLTQAAGAVTADNSDDEVRFGVGAAKSLIAFGVMYSNPLPALSFDGIESEPVTNRLDKINRLERAEKRLQDRAEAADNIHTWKRHGTAILFNLSTSAIISIFGNDKDAIASAVGGILASELNIWTQPSGASKDWKNYQRQNTSELSWILLPTANGIALNVRF